MIIEYLKDGKKMLKNKVVIVSNVSSNNFNYNNASSSVPNTLFELMKENILIVNQIVEINKNNKSNTNNKK